MEETVSKKKSLSETLKEHPKTTFFARLTLWTMLAGVLPFLFIAYRFQLFRTVSKIQIGGWGLIAIIIAAVFIFVLLKYLRAYLKAGYTFWGQCLTGFIKVILPLAAFYIILYNIRNNLDLFLQALGCVIVCEFFAIPVNPFPKAIYDRQKNIRVEERKEGVDYFIDEFIRRTNEKK